MHECKECGSSKQIEVDRYTTMVSASYCGSCGSVLININNKTEGKVPLRANPIPTNQSQDKDN